MADDVEHIKRITLGDPRSPGEKVAAMIGRALSPDKHQNRQWDDSDQKRAKDRAETQARLKREKDELDASRGR